jgi:succinyl-CoA synthetase alpha subunit
MISTNPNVWVNKYTRVICQGITGNQGTFQTQQALGYGTQMVDGVNLKIAGTTHLGLPVFKNCFEAKKATSCKCIRYLRSSTGAADAIIEAQLDLVVVITDGIPQHDMIKVKHALRSQSKT